MSVYEERSLLFSRHRQRSTTWDEDEVIVTVGSHTKGDEWTEHEIDNSQLLEAVKKLTQHMRPNGEYVEATREVAMSVTSAVDELKAVSRDPEVKKIWQVRSACERTAEAVARAYEYIDKVDDIPWYGCSEEMRDLAEKTTTYSSNAIHSDLKAFKSIVDKMQKSSSAAEEYYLALRAECEQAVRSCNEAEAACYRKAEEQRRKKKTTQIVGGTLAAAGIGAAIVGGGVVTVAIGVLIAGIGSPIVAGITAAVAGGIATAGTAGVGTAITIAETFDKDAKKFSNAKRKCASVGSSALRLSRAAADVRCDLDISKELDAALDQPLYTVTSTRHIQSEKALLLDNSRSARQITEECRQTLFQKRQVAYSCHRTWQLSDYVYNSTDSL